MPNKTIIPIPLFGDIKLSHYLALKDVLFTLQFHFNLISINALRTDSSLIVSFFLGEFVIQDPNSQKMIGKGDLFVDL